MPSLKYNLRNIPKMYSYSKHKTGLSRTGSKVFRRSIKKKDYKYFFLSYDLKAIKSSYCILFWFKSKQCSTLLTLIRYANGSYCYSKLIHGLNIGDIINNPLILFPAKIKYGIGMRIFCKYLIPFSICSNIATNKNLIPKYVRAAGTYSQLFDINTDKGLFSFKLPTGKVLKFTPYNVVTIGRNSNIEWSKLKFYKAGERILLGRRPVVRGVARNPVDHPNGGRTKSKSPEKSLWGWIAKLNK